MWSIWRIVTVAFLRRVQIFLLTYYFALAEFEAATGCESENGDDVFDDTSAK